jgi:hypothetical protein
MRGREPAAALPSAGQQLTTKSYRLKRILDFDRESDEVLVEWVGSRSWEDQALMQREVGEASWEGHMAEKERRRGKLVERSFIGPYVWHRAGLRQGGHGVAPGHRHDDGCCRSPAMEGDWPTGNCKGQVRWSRALIA